MGHSDGLLEGEDHPDEGSRADHRDIRFNPRCRERHAQGFDMAHKLPGVSSSHTGPKNFRKEQNEHVTK